MERDLPGGRVQNDVEILAREHPTSFAIHTTSGPTPLVYRYRFSPQNGHTVVELDAAFELDGVAAVLAPLARRAVKRGVADNFASLKKVLETRARPR